MVVVHHDANLQTGGGILSNVSSDVQNSLIYHFVCWALSKTWPFLIFTQVVFVPTVQNLTQYRIEKRTIERVCVIFFLLGCNAQDTTFDFH